MSEEVKALEALEKPAPATPLEVVTLVLKLHIKDGNMDVGGHLDNLHLNLQMLVVAGNILVERAAKVRQAKEAAKNQIEQTH